jgi:aminopeptidase N
MLKRNFIYQRIEILLFILFAFSDETYTQQQQNIIKPVPINAERSKKIDVKHIAIDLRFDWKKKQAYGAAAITFAPLNPANTVTLDAGMLTINSIVLANGKSLKFNYDGSDKNDGLEIRLDRIYKEKEDVIIKIDYHTNWINNNDANNLWGGFGKGMRFFEPTSTEPRKRRQIWTVGIPESNRYWFPCYDAPDDFRTTELKATLDKKLTVISNGKLIETKNNNDGTHTFHWKMDIPYANHQTSFVAGEYVDIKQQYEDVTLHNYSYPDETEATKASIARLTDMMKFYSDRTGMKYPYPSYSQVFVQDFPWGGGHNMMASTLSENMIDDFGTHADFLSLWDGVEANDLAAQWFGNLLTPHSWEHSWLSKSFTNYFSGLYSEYKNGPDEFQLWNRTFNQTAYKGDWDAGIRRPVVTKNYDEPATMINDNYGSIRGAEVLHMLRKQLGEEDWWKAIRHYVKSNACKTVTTEDFSKAIRESTGEEMDWFFDQWIYKMGHPVFAVIKKYDADKKQLELFVRQIQKKDSASGYPQADFFKGKMELEIDGKIEKIWIEAKPENIFTFQVAEKPKLVHFDYGSTRIKELKFEKIVDELLYQFQNDKDILGRYDAMMELAAKAKNDSSFAGHKTKIFDAFRKVITGKSHWRLRQTAIAQLRSLMKQQPDSVTIKMLLSLIQNDVSLVRSTALFFLSDTKDKKYAPLYIKYLTDKSDRVINAAAFALGKSKSPKAYDALIKLKDKPSWKNQSLISTLNGLKQLGDPRGIVIALNALKDTPAAARWTLPTPIWDFRITAAETLVALGKGSSGFPVVYERFKKSIIENDISDIFNNVLLITTLADPRGQEVFEMLKSKFKDDANALVAVNVYETQFREAIKK